MSETSAYTHESKHAPDGEEVDHHAGERELVGLIPGSVQLVEVALQPRHQHQRAGACKHMVVNITARRVINKGKKTMF